MANDMQHEHAGLPENGAEQQPEESSRNSEQTVASARSTTWMNFARIWIPTIVFGIFTLLAKRSLRPGTPAMSILPPGLVATSLAFVAANMLHRDVASDIKLPRSYLRSTIYSLLYACLTTGSFSLASLAWGLGNNIYAELYRSYIGDATVGSTPWQRFRFQVTGFVGLSVLKFLVSSWSSLDWLLDIAVRGYAWGSFAEMFDFTVDYVCRQQTTRSRQWRGLLLVNMVATIAMIMLLRTSFFTTGGTTCPERYRKLLSTYYCRQNIKLNDPLALYQQEACTVEFGLEMGVTEIGHALNASSMSLGRLCLPSDMSSAQTAGCVARSSVSMIGPGISSTSNAEGLEQIFKVMISCWDGDVAVSQGISHLRALVPVMKGLEEANRIQRENERMMASIA